MALNLEPIPKGFLVRWYSRSNTLRYDWTITVAARGKGEYEPIGWTRPPNAKAGYHFTLFRQLEDTMQKEVGDFRCLTGTFNNRELRLQERLWRKEYQLIPIKQVEKEYNGEILEATYVRFERRGG